MIRDVKDLSPDQKMAVESLLGRPVSEQETVSVQAFEPAAISGQRRQEIAEALRQYFAEVDAKRQPVSAEEADDILNEAMRSTRPDYRPRQ
jgi:thiamine biosynthesis lipoprotein ApbE